MRLIVYCTLEPLGTKWYIQQKGTEKDGINKILNNGEPWLCKDGNGLTGDVGMEIEANNEAEAKEIMLSKLRTMKELGKEPMIWQ